MPFSPLLLPTYMESVIQRHSQWLHDLRYTWP